MAETPQWAKDLTERVCAERGLDVPQVQFWNSRQHETTGTSWSAHRLAAGGPRIQVTVGSDGHAQPVLLHELAHLLAPRGANHGGAFWRIAFDLYERYGEEDIDQFVVREFAYRETAATVARTLPRWSSLTRVWLTHRQQARGQTAGIAARGAVIRPGQKVRFVGLRASQNGALAEVVEVKYTRAKVRLITPAGKWSEGAEVMAPMDCMEVI